MTERHKEDLIETLLGECKLQKREDISIELVKAPRLLPFAYDPEAPNAPKLLDWWKISFATA